MSLMTILDMLRFGNVPVRHSTYWARRIHATKKGPGRSWNGMHPKQKSAGRKIAKKAFEGVLGLRNGIGAAGRIAQQNNWGT